MATFHFHFGGSSRRSKKALGKSSIGGRIAGALFGFIFFAAGAAFLYFMFARPIFGMIAAQWWQQVPCVVMSSELETSYSDDGNTYSILIQYRYEFNGKTYRGDRYNFINFKSSGYSGKNAIINAHPPGHQTTCWVNPDDPKESVINRGWSHALWFGLIPLVFVIVGGAIMFFSLFGSSKKGLGSSAKKVDWLPEPKYHIEGGQVVLRAQGSRLGKLIGVTFAMVFWNGIVSVFATHVISSHIKGDPLWFLTIFLIPFVLVGLALVLAVPYQFFALFNPKFTFTIDAEEIHPGDVLQLKWEISGAMHRLKSVKIELIGEESATYRRGTDTHTDTHEFMKTLLYETADDARLVLSRHAMEIAIPADAMHSFEASNNKVTWKLQVRGDVPRWPDVKESYPIVVSPPGAEGAKA